MQQQLVLLVMLVQTPHVHRLVVERNLREIAACNIQVHRVEMPIVARQYVRWIHFAVQRNGTVHVLSWRVKIVYAHVMDHLVEVKKQDLVLHRTRPHSAIKRIVVASFVARRHLNAVRLHGTLIA